MAKRILVAVIFTPALLAVMLAVVLVCGLGTVFVTSAAEKPDLRSSLTVIPSENYTEEESRKLFSLWFEGYEDMTVTAFREKMRGERSDADMELIERFSLDGDVYELPAGKEADALKAFNDYFFAVYEPLTADYWEIWCFDGDGANGMQYQCDLTVLDGDALTVGKYEELRYKAEALLRQSSGGDEDASAAAALSTSGWKRASIPARTTRSSGKPPPTNPPPAGTVSWPPTCPWG